MKRLSITQKTDVTKVYLLLTFGTAFGYVEAAVVYYLRLLMHFRNGYPITNYHVLLNLGFITFVSPIQSLLISNRVNEVEVAREACTIIMLVSIAWVAGRDTRQRFGAFLVGFATWDITYYIFLRVLDNWPSSLFTKDVYFLIPVTWIGPVITPIIISSVLLVTGVWLFLYPRPHKEAA